MQYISMISNHCTVIFHVLALTSTLACTPPAGFEPQGDSGRHFYQLVSTERTIDQAKSYCQQFTGAHLADFPTEEEYKNVVDYRGKCGYDFWIGMFNPSGYECNSKSQCAGKVEWSDGTPYVDHSWQDLETRSNRGHNCHRVPSATYAADDAEGCGSDYKYGTLCQFSCQPVDGMWSDWSSHSACSNSCGGGMQTRGRTCDNPAPMYGGAQCAGVEKETRSCNTQDCLKYCNDDPPTIDKGSRGAFTSPSVEGTKTT